MEINRIDSTTYLGKDKFLREFGGTLKNGNTANFAVCLNNGGNPYCMECYITDKFGETEGKGIARKPKLKLQEVLEFLDDISVKTEGWDVIREFFKAIRK